VLLHLPPLVKSQRAWLLKKTGGQPDLANVVYKAAQVGFLLFVFA